MRTSVALCSSPSPKAATLAGSRTTRCLSTNGSPMSLTPTTWVASVPNPWPICMANRVPPLLRRIGLNISVIPANGLSLCSPAPPVSASARASDMLSATGWASRFQTPIVCSIHSARLHATGVPLTRANPVA